VGGIELTPSQVQELRQALPGCLVSWWQKPKIDYPRESQRGD